jgi:hypothetical protein
MIKDHVKIKHETTLRETNKKLNLDLFAQENFNLSNRYTLAVFHLSEQKLKQVRRNFYHISPIKVNKLKTSTFYGGQQHQYGTIFLSNSVKFCIDFYKLGRKEFGSIAYLYTCKLKNYLINLFNMDYQKDWFRCEKFINRDNQEEFEKLYNQLYKEKYEDRWIDLEQSILPDLIYESGFDGFSNFGFFPDIQFHSANNMAIFEEKNIEIIDIKEIDIYKNYIEDKFNIPKEDQND